jgi:hypothetical protein
VADGNEKTLLDRIGAILAKNRPNRESGIFRLVSGCRPTCKICGALRDSDPTGVTCGQERCLLAIGEEVLSLEKRLESALAEKGAAENERTGTEDLIRKFARKINIPIERDDFESFLDSIAVELIRWRDSKPEIVRIAELLGVDAQQKIDDVIVDILLELQDIKKSIEEAESAGTPKQH